MIIKEVVLPREKQRIAEFLSRFDLKLSQYVGNKINATVIVTGYSSSWKVVIVDEVTEYVPVLSEIASQIFADVTNKLVAETYVSLSLPTEYAEEPGIDFAWSVVSGNEISITDNKATVTPGETEVTVTIKLTLTAGTQSEEKTFDVIVKNITKATSYADALNAELGTLLEVEGTVLSLTHDYNSNESIIERYSAVIYDAQYNLLTVDLQAEVWESLSLGDTIVAIGTPGVGAYGAELYLNCTTDAAVKEQASKDYKTDLSNFTVEELTTDDQYNQLLNDDWAAKAGNVIYRVTAPYLCYSGNTSYSWVRFGASSAASDGYNGKYSCFSLPYLDNLYPAFYEIAEVPFLADGALQRPAISFYILPMYSTSTTRQFCFVDTALIEVDYSIIAENEIKSSISISTLEAVEAGVLELPSYTNYATDITWTASHPDFINTTTGEYVQATEKFILTLTASYKVNGEDKSTTVSILVLNEKIVPVTVTQALNSIETGETEVTVQALTGYIAAFGTDSNNTKDKEHKNGYYITDGVNVLWYKTDEFKIEGSDLNVGDEILFMDVTLSTKNGGSLISAGNPMSIQSTGNSIDWSNIALDATITSQEEMLAWAATTVPAEGMVLKFTGTFYLIGTGSSNGDGCRYQINFNSEATASADARYTFNLSSNANKTLSIKACNGLLIDEWWTTAGIPQASGSNNIKVTGTIYVVSGTWGNTMWAWNFINADGWSLSKVVEEA